ncbi:cadherin-like protein 26 isoform X1 [Sander lucioperca]|uniref:cadherin-like protein 26 isoform X1 n=1 Tax=Sander lucioperca TaxID=283035 RepID=UPI00125DFCC6|nr:cadherin-like protein 26 isoform X1 [Sander lucioperca]
MKNISLLLLVALTALTESRQGYNIRRDKRELLVRSKRRWVLSTIEIIEENKGPFPKEIAKMYNDQTDQEGQIYRISVKSATGNLIEGVFSINESTGLVYVHQRIDREEIDLFKITFDILSKKTRKEIDKRLAFDIQIKDINDNAPTFIDLPTNVEVKENTEEGFLPVQLKVMDRDETNTPNSEITIRVVKQTPAEPKIDLKMMNDGMAQLTFTGCFDYDKVKKYEVTVEAKDHGSPSLSSTAVVTLNVVDSNSHPPTFKEKKYQGEVLESVIKDDILRIAVDDKDTPKTPGWRAKYYFIEGNQEGNYKIETDPATNEGILSVIKGKDFEVTTTTTLRVGVANEEPLFVCKSKSTGGAGPPPDTVNITIKVIDANDPPNYEKDPFVVYQKEEEVPGKVLFTPKVKDVDSDESQIRHMIIKDPAGWVTIDEKTGTLTTTKKMDRESPFVDDKGIYKIIVGAKDNGEPPATGTCTVLVHLRDINDNVPKLVNKELIMCGNKGNMVMVSANDTDADPYSGPFAFSLGGDDKTLTQRWKLDPAFGKEGGLVSLTTLAYGNYSVPLVIQDQQSSIGRDTLKVIVCDCGEGDVCRSKVPSSSSLGSAGIGLLLLGLLLFLLLLLLFICQCGGRAKPMPMVEDEGNQTLIKYNQEAGGSECKAEPTLLLTPRNSVAVTDGLKLGTMQMSQAGRRMAQDRITYDSSGLPANYTMTSMDMQPHRDTLGSQEGGQTMYSTWTTNRVNTYQGGSSRYNRSLSLLSNHQITDHIARGGSSRYNRSLSLLSNHQITDHIARRLHTIDGKHVDHPVYLPYEYAFEGQGSQCQSLDSLSLSNLGDDLMFLNNLGPKFKTLGGICHQTLQGKNIQL